MAMQLTRFERLSIRHHPELSESWVQDQIAADPKILNLGDLVLKDKERRQPRAGRLDLLLQDAEENRRYEVEVQLGAIDESHIIRTIEYWDIERRRYPQYEHTAVIVAEDITSRFLNIIALFNGMIPLVAIQMSALKSGDSVGLVFTTVVDQLPLGLVDEDEEVQEATDRAYWEDRASKMTLNIADELLTLTHKVDPKVEFKYNKLYIGLAKDGKAFNFLQLRPKKQFIRFEPRLPDTVDFQRQLEESGLDVMDYDKRWGRYRIRLQEGDIEKHRDVLQKIIEAAHSESGDG
jgi:hypothetical protein